MISVSHLTKRYRHVVAVDDLSFEVNKGEIVGLLGPNGAGKSTVMRILACYLTATGGRVRVAGHDAFTESMDVRRRIGYLPETVPLYPDMRVDEFLRYRAKLKRLPAKKHAAMIAEVKERCGLNELGKHMIGSLSRGYRQRVGLADALVHNPDVLILDEPTLGLDPNQNQQIRMFIRSLAEKHTVLLSTHILPEVEMICGRVMVMAEGRMVAADTPERLKDSFRGPNLIRAEIRGPVQDVQKQLAMLPMVLRVELVSENGWSVYRVEAPRDVDVRPALFDVVVRNGWRLRALTQEKRRFEDVYLKLTGQEEESVP